MATEHRIVAPVGVLAGSALGLLFARSATWFNLATVSPDLAPARTFTTIYFALAGTVAALLVWHRWPARSWPWLLLAGAVCAVPDAVLWVAPATFQPSIAEVYSVLSVCAPTITMIGILGAATQLWHADRRPTAAALTGAAILVQVVGPTAIGTLFSIGPKAYGWTTLALVAIALAGSLAAIVRATPVDQDRPAWRVTLLGAVGTLSPLLLFHWPPGGDTAGHLRALGLVLLALGLAAGAAAGRRALRAASTTGLLVGALSTLLVQVPLPDVGAFAALLAAATIAAGIAAARAPSAPRIATAGLTTVTVGLLATFVLYVVAGPTTTTDVFTPVLAPLLAAIGVVAATAAIGTTTATLAPHAEPPAVLAGIAIPLALATVALIASLAASPPLGRAPIGGLVPGLLIATLTATALLRPRPA